MKTSKQNGLLWSLAIVVAFFALGIQTASAQLNERQVERQASGIYQGGLTAGRKVYKDPNPHFNYTGRPHSANGKVKVPIKDGKLKSALRDNDIPGNGRALAVGKERKSTVKRGGKLVVLSAKGTLDVRQDAYGAMKGGTISGNTTKRGSKWLANTKLKGHRKEGTGTATYSCTAKGKN